MKMEQGLGLIVLVIALYILWQIRQLLLLVFTAVVLATAINRLVQRFQQSGLKRSRAVLVSVCLVGTVLGMLLTNPQPYRRVFIRFFPAFYRHRVDKILTRCADGLGDWTTGALLEMAFIGTMSGLGLWLFVVAKVWIEEALFKDVLDKWQRTAS